MGKRYQSNSSFIIIRSAIWIAVMIVYMINIGPLLREPESRPYFVILGLVLFIGGMILLIMSIVDKSKSSLNESEVNYRILVETSNDLIANIDRKGNFLFMNNAYVKTLGYVKEELLKINFFELVHLDDLEKVIQKLSALSDKQSVNVIECKLIVKSGKLIYVSLNASTISGEEVSDATILLSIQNISDRKQAEKKLRESEQRYRLLSENSNILIWTYDMGFKCTYVSPSVFKVLGYTQEEFMDKTLDEIVDTHSFDILMQGIMEEVALENKEDRDLNRIRTEELMYVHNNGRFITCEMTATFLRDSKGDPIGFLGSTKDITERKKLEDDLKESLERHRLISENAKDLIYSLDFALNITFLNDTVNYNLGYEINEMLNRNFSNFITNNSLNNIASIFQEELNNEEEDGINSSRVRTFELELIHKNGSIINMESTNTFIRDSKGEIIGILGVARNISDLKKTMAELKSTIEALEGYVYKISHDIKTPLTSLANFLTLYLRKKKPELDSESEHYFERIKGNIEIMKNLIENVFENYTHVENRKPDVKDSVIEIEMR